MSTLASELAVAWANRASRAAETSGHARRAPGLFKPEFVAELDAEFETAVRWSNYWQAQAVAEGGAQ